MSVESAAVTRRLTVTHQGGLHARPSLAIVKTAQRFQSRVLIHNGRQEANARDILQILSMGAAQGTEIRLSAEGPDAEEALDALVKLFANDFGMSE